MFIAKVVVITGASSGIGAALAVLLAERGDSVVIVARRPDALTAVAHRCQGRAHAVVADVSVRADVRRVVDEALAAFGRIDVWINNVGRGITRVPSELTDEDMRPGSRDWVLGYYSRMGEDPRVPTTQ